MRRKIKYGFRSIKRIRRDRRIGDRRIRWQYFEYTPETFPRPVQSRGKRGLDKRGRRATPHRKGSESQSLDSRSLLEIILADDTSGATATHRHACAWREWGRGLARLTYDKFNALLPAAVPSFLADTCGPGPHAGYYYFHSFPHVCLPARPSVRLPVHPFRSSFSRLSPLSGRAPSPAPRKSLFGCFRRTPPEASLFPPPRTRDGALSFLRATRDGKSSRPPLLLGRYLSAGFLSTSFARTNSETLTYNYSCNYTL